MNKQFDLQLFAADNNRAALLRNAIADYAEFDGEYVLMGAGFTKLDESPGAQTESETYINEVTASADVIGYETEFAYESKNIPTQKAIYKLWKMGRDHATGPDAQFKYVRVDLFNPIGTATEQAAEYTARLFLVANEVSEFAGEGGQKLTVSGTLHAVGDPVQGKFDIVTKKFTSGTFQGKYDTMHAPTQTAQTNSGS